MLDRSDMESEPAQLQFEGLELAKTFNQVMDHPSSRNNQKEAVALAIERTMDTLFTAKRKVEIALVSDVPSDPQTPLTPFQSLRYFS